MRNIWIIAKREYNHFWISTIAYVVAFMIRLTTGIIFAINILYFIQNAFQSFGQTPDIGPITGAFGFLLVLSIPAITMRLLADEARMGTLELLLSGPTASGSRPMPNGQKQEPGGWNRVVLKVADLPQCVAALKKAGVHLRNEMEAGPGGRQIQIEDPDGNPIELFEPAR